MATLNSTLKLTLLDQVSARARVISGALNNLQNQQRRFMAPFGGNVTGLLATIGAYVGVREGIDNTVGAAIRFEDAFSGVRKVVDATDEQFAGFRRNIIDLSKQLPISANDIAGLYAAAAESGIATEELGKFAELAARVGIAFDIPAQTAGEQLAKLKTQLGLSVAETGDLADALNHLSNSMASKAGDIQNFMLRVGALAEMGGFAKEEIAALGSAMIAAGAEPETAATAMQNVTKALARGKFAKASQKAAAKALGLDLPGIAKMMQREAPGALKKVLGAIAKAPKDQQMTLLSEFFGDEAKAFSPLVGNIKLLDQALDLVSSKTKFAGSAMAEYRAKAATTSNQIQKLQNNFSALGIAIGDSFLPKLNEGIDGILDLFETLGQRATVFDDVTAGLKGLMTGLGFEGSLRDGMNQFWDAVFGPADGSESADRLGRIFMRFKEFGTWLKEQKADFDNSAIGQALTKLGGMGVKLMLAGVGIGILAGTMKALGKALYYLSGAKTAVDLLTTIAAVQNKLNAGTLTGAVTAAGTSAGTLYGAAFSAAAGAAMAAGLLLVLKELDPEGNLGGITKPIDDFIEKMSGWNPSKDGLSFGDILDGTGKLLPGKTGFDTLWNLLTDNGPIKPEISGAKTPQQVLALDNARRGRALGFGGSTDTIPGKLADDYNIGVATNLKAIIDRMSAIIPAKSTNTYLDDTGSHPVKIDASSISAMVQPSGVQQVHVVNSAVPNVNVSNNITVTGVVDPVAAANSTASQIGQKVKDAVESTHTD